MQDENGMEKWKVKIILEILLKYYVITWVKS